MKNTHFLLLICLTVAHTPQNAKADNTDIPKNLDQSLMDRFEKQGTSFFYDAGRANDKALPMTQSQQETDVLSVGKFAAAAQLSYVEQPGHAYLFWRKPDIKALCDDILSGKKNSRIDIDLVEPEPGKAEAAAKPERVGAPRRERDDGQKVSDEVLKIVSNHLLAGLELKEGSVRKDGSYLIGKNIADLPTESQMMVLYLLQDGTRYQEQPLFLDKAYWNVARLYLSKLDNKHGPTGDFPPNSWVLGLTNGNGSSGLNLGISMLVHGEVK